MWAKTRQAPVEPNICSITTFGNPTLSAIHHNNLCPEIITITTQVIPINMTFTVGTSTIYLLAPFIPYVIFTMVGLA